ncbi:MAG TPA: hypothetical protein PL051_04310 [Candidatus Saccharibacteria bacterium]|nr:hypothetical protein [Candidatus Saccharibacteria bacterium]
MPERYTDRFDSYSRVIQQEKLLKRLFRIAHIHTDLDINPDSDDEDLERYFSLFWREYYKMLLEEEPNNPGIILALKTADTRVDDILERNGFPEELRDLD